MRFDIVEYIFSKSTLRSERDHCKTWKRFLTPKGSVCFLTSFNSRFSRAHRIRKALCIFFIIFFFYILFPSSLLPSQGFYMVGISSFSSASASARVVRYGMVVLSPFFFKDEHGNYKGYMPDLLRFLAENEGWRLSFIDAGGEELVKMLQEGEIDLLSMAPTPRLEGLFDFAKSHHYSTWYTFFTRSDSEILTFQDLEGKTISMQSGFYALSELRRILDGIGIRYTIAETPTVEEALEMLSSGAVDVCAAEQLASLAKIRRFDFRRSPVIFAPSKIFFATTKGKNAELLVRLDEKLEGLYKSSVSLLEVLLRRWYYDDEFTFFPQWAVWGFFVAAILLTMLSVGFFVIFRKGRQLRLQRAQLQERLDSERFLSDAARMLLTEGGHEDVLRNACRKIREVIDARRILLLRSTFSSTRRRLIEVSFEYASPGLTLISEHSEVRSVPISDIPRNWLIELTRKQIVKERLDETPLKKFFPFSETAFFSFYPLFEGGRFWGVLAVNIDLNTDSSEAKDILLSTFSEMISAHLLRKRQERRLLRIATTDALTGLANRRYFFETLDREIARSLRRGHPLSLILCDIDIFKNVNDTYGHDIGDDVLRQFARVLRKGVRAEDFPVRYGGEEFGVLLPETEMKDALQTAERLRLYVEKTRFDIGKGVDRTVSLNLTASFGVQQFLGANDSASAIFSRADCALYEAKTGGRNRVVPAISEHI